MDETLNPGPDWKAELEARFLNLKMVATVSGIELQPPDDSRYDDLLRYAGSTFASIQAAGVLAEFLAISAGVSIEDAAGAQTSLTKPEHPEPFTDPRAALVSLLAIHARVLTELMALAALDPDSISKVSRDELDIDW